MSDLLAEIELDADRLGEIAERLGEDELTSAANTLAAMTQFAALDGDDSALYEDTLEMRRSHLAAWAAAADAARDRLLNMLDASALYDRIPDPALGDTVREHLAAAGEALAEIVKALSTVPDRDRDGGGTGGSY